MGSEVAVSTLHLEPWLTLGLALLFLALLLKLGHFPGWCPAPQPTKRRSPRPLRPRTPDDCPFGQETDGSPAGPKTVVPYSQRKSPRGRKKGLDPQGYAWPHPDCDYFRNANVAGGAGCSDLSSTADRVCIDNKIPSGNRSRMPAMGRPVSIYAARTADPPATSNYQPRPNP